MMYIFSRMDMALQGCPCSAVKGMHNHVCCHDMHTLLLASVAMLSLQCYLCKVPLSALTASSVGAAAVCVVAVSPFTCPPQKDINDFDPDSQKLLYFHSCHGFLSDAVDYSRLVFDRLPTLVLTSLIAMHKDLTSKACYVGAGGADSKEASCDEWLVFEVTDTGCGISKQGLASLFTEYVQVKLQILQSELTSATHWC